MELININAWLSQQPKINNGKSCKNCIFHGGKMYWAELRKFRATAFITRSHMLGAQALDTQGLCLNLSYITYQYDFGQITVYFGLFFLRYKMDITAILIHSALLQTFVITCVFNSEFVKFQKFITEHTISQVYIQKVCISNYLIKYMDTSEVKYMTIHVERKTIHSLMSVCFRF